jgi:hypothetical protein
VRAFVADGPLTDRDASEAEIDRCGLYDRAVFGVFVPRT